MSRWAASSLVAGLLALLAFAGGSRGSAESSLTDERGGDKMVSSVKPFVPSTRVVDVMNDTAFAGFGRLIFPVDRKISDRLMLKDVGDILIWYSHVNPGKTVEIVNYMKEESLAGRKIFFSIYTEEEMNADPWKRNTGLFGSNIV